jgi:hypothetical protein
MELEMLEDWLNNPESTRELTEVELLEKVTEQKVSQEETAKLKSTQSGNLRPQMKMKNKSWEVTVICP